MKQAPSCSLKCLQQKVSNFKTTEQNSSSLTHKHTVEITTTCTCTYSLNKSTELHTNENISSVHNLHSIILAKCIDSTLGAPQPPMPHVTFLVHSHISVATPLHLCWIILSKADRLNRYTSYLFNYVQIHPLGTHMSTRGNVRPRVCGGAGLKWACTHGVGMFTMMDTFMLYIYTARCYL